MKSFALLLSVAAIALAADVTVSNNCVSTIYIKPDSQGVTASVQQIPPRQTWTTNLQGMGAAYKLSYHSSAANPIQFDYSVSSDGITYYDVSDPGHPFDVNAVSPGCNPVACPGNCQKVESCPSDKSFTVQACP